MPEAGRPDPDALIATAAQEGRGRLKLFLGAAPGVGKTFAMLSQARQRLADGADVLAGVVETHGRAETETQIGDLPVLPRHCLDYRGQSLTEFDLDAALARRPALLLVDELAHTNIPGSRHAKRWEDVAELLGAGITVWATLNVQHLESLNDDIARITGVRVAETLPDRVLDMADEIELIDVPPAALRERMRAGKIYRADTAGRALDGFFKEGNLAALREIALRRAAAHVDTDVRSWMRRAGIAGPWPVQERLIVLVGPDRLSETVVRHAKRLAEALHAPWIALHVERGQSPAEAGPALALAEQLGAEIETRAGTEAGTDIVGSALAVAQSRNATHLVMGRSPSPWWRRVLGRTLSAQLLRAAPDLALHVVPLPQQAVPCRTPLRLQADLASWAGSVGVVAGITGAGLVCFPFIPGEAMGMIYVAGVVLAATFWDLRAALVAAGLAFFAWDFFFLPPLYKISIGSPRDIVAAMVFGVVAVLTGGLASRVRVQARAAQARVEGLRRIAAFSRGLGEPTTEPDLLAEIARQAAGIANRAVVLEADLEDVRIRASQPGGDTMDEGAWAAARWCWRHDEATGRGTGTLPGTHWRFLPLHTARGRLGVLGVRSDLGLNEPQSQALSVLADQAAIAWERVRLAGQQARAEAFAETQRLRTALLASLGHDLRTPLTGIQGAAGTLRGAWNDLPPETRADLLDSIDEDVSRMARFLSNITELTRLESGQIQPRTTTIRVADAISAAIARVPGTPHIAVALPDPALTAVADPALLEQVLVNVLENAVKYSPEASLVGVRAQNGDGLVTITVADEGIGVNGDDLPHIFDSFFRARRGDRVAPGTGLGLSIAKGLIEAMGGSIALRSPRTDRAADALPGTLATITVPAA